MSLIENNQFSKFWLHVKKFKLFILSNCSPEKHGKFQSNIKFTLDYFYEIELDKL